MEEPGLGVDVAVIGGGITGLTAAYEALKRGLTVRLIEPGAPGGVVETHREDGWVLECGPNVLLAKPPLLELLKQLGLEEEVCPPAVKRYEQYVWYNDRPVAVPRGLVALLRSPLLSASQKLQLALGLVAPGGVGSLAADESVADFFGRTLGREVVSRIMDPVLKGIYGGDLAKLSMRSLFPNLWSHCREGGSIVGFIVRRAKEREGGRPIICTLRGGISRLVEVLVDSLGERIVQKKVEAIRSAPQPLQGGRRWVVEVSREGSTLREELLASHVIVTTSGKATAHFIGGVSSEVQARLQAVTATPLVVLHIDTSAEVALPKRGFGVLFPEGRPSRLLGVMCSSVLFPHLAPTGRSLLTVTLGGFQQQAVLEKSDEELSVIVKSELAKTLGIRLPLRILRVTRWPAAIPQFLLGYHAVESALCRLESSNAGLYFAGVDRGGVGVPDRVLAARRVVERIDESTIKG